MLALPGLALLARRNFLAHLGSGLGAIALADLLAREGTAAEARPWRPAIRLESPGREVREQQVLRVALASIGRGHAGLLKRAGEQQSADQALDRPAVGHEIGR